jgi:hypothetical protein
MPAGVSAGSVSSAAPSSRPLLTLQLALEEYHLALEKLDTQASGLAASLGGRSVSLMSLPPEHPIFALLQAVRRVGERTTPDQRDHAIVSFAQKVFRRMYESPSDSLLAQVC